MNRRRKVVIEGFKHDYRLCREHNSIVERVPEHMMDVTDGKPFRCLKVGAMHPVSEQDTYYPKQEARFLASNEAESVVQDARTEIFE